MHAEGNGIHPFDPRGASDTELALLNTFQNILRAETLPEDPPIPLSEDMDRWRTLPPLIEETAWCLRDGSPERILAFAETRIYHTGDNEHLMEFNIEVLPEHRCRGIARRMLRLITDNATAHNRRLMTSESNSRVPAGAEFLARIGGRRGLEARLNQLRLSELDRDLIQRWLRQSSALAAQFSVGFWEGKFPESRLQELADLMQVVANDQPRDSLDMEDIHYTPEFLRQWEAAMLAGGHERWILYATDRRDDRIVGETEVVWNPNRPATLWQGFTGVLPAYRVKGIGRWLKAEMLNRVLRDRPQVQVIRTGNANSNAPMLKINVAMGFEPVISWTTWEVPTETAAQYLARAA